MAEDTGGPANHRLRHALQQGRGVGEDVAVVGVGAVPFEHGELRFVQPAAFAGTEAGTELEQARIAGRQEPLHMQFGGGAKEPGAGGLGVDEIFQGRGREADRSVDFEEIVRREEGANRLQAGVALAQAPGEGAETVAVVRHCGGLLEQPVGTQVS